MPQKKTQHYVPPEAFHKEYKLSQEKGEPTRKLLLMFEKIAKGYSSKYRFRNKLDIDACVNYALTEAWLKWDRYDPERSSNIFSFFTSVIKNDINQHYGTIMRYRGHLSIDVLFSNTKNI